MEYLPTHTIASASIEAANATRGDSVNHAHQLCFAGSAATRARTRTSNAAEGSIIGSSSSSACTDRNSFTRNWHAAHVERCFSISSRSSSFRRPSTYPKILFSIRLQLMTSFLLYPGSTALLAAPRAGLVPLAAFRTPGTAAISARSPSNPKSSKSLRSPAPGTCATARPHVASPAISQSHAGSSCAARPRRGAARCSDAFPRRPASSRRRPRHPPSPAHRSEEHTSELQSLAYLVCRLLLEKKKKKKKKNNKIQSKKYYYK